MLHVPHPLAYTLLPNQVRSPTGDGLFSAIPPLPFMEVISQGYSVKSSEVTATISGKPDLRPGVQRFYEPCQSVHVLHHVLEASVCVS